MRWRCKTRRMQSKSIDWHTGIHRHRHTISLLLNLHHHCACSFHSLSFTGIHHEHTNTHIHGNARIHRKQYIRSKHEKHLILTFTIHHAVVNFLLLISFFFLFFFTSTTCSFFLLAVIYHFFIAHFAWALSWMWYVCAHANTSILAKHQIIHFSFFFVYLKYPMSKHPSCAHANKLWPIY